MEKKLNNSEVLFIWMTLIAFLTFLNIRKRKNCCKLRTKKKRIILTARYAFAIKKLKRIL